MPEVPKLLGGRYEVAELLGRGGMAEVHRGYDSRLGRQVAIKMLRSELARDHTFLARFRREAQSAAGLNHASIVAVYDHGEDLLTETGLAVFSVLSWEDRDLAEAFGGTAPAPGGAFRQAEFVPTPWGPRLASATTWAGALAWVAVSVERERRGQALGTVFGLAVLGFVCGPMFGGVADLVGIRASFVGVALVAAGLAGLVVGLFTWWPYAAIGAAVLIVAGLRWLRDARTDIAHLPRKQPVSTAPIPLRRSG